MLRVCLLVGWKWPYLILLSPSLRVESTIDRWAGGGGVSIRGDQLTGDKPIVSSLTTATPPVSVHCPTANIFFFCSSTLKTHRAVADGSPANTVTLQRLPPLRPLIIADVNIIARIMLLSFDKVVVVFIIGAIAHTIHEIATVKVDAYWRPVMKRYCVALLCDL